MKLHTDGSNIYDENEDCIATVFYEDKATDLVKRHNLFPELVEALEYVNSVCLLDIDIGKLLTKAKL